MSNNVGTNTSAIARKELKKLESATASISPFRRALQRFARNPVAMIATGYLVLMILVAIFGPFIMPADPTAQTSIPFLPPSGEHWLGTDDLGRDTASRLIAGAIVSVRAGFQTVGLALLVAVPLGLIAGYFAGQVDNIFMRIMDAINSFPALILALVIAAVLGPGLDNAMLAIAIVLVPGIMRLVRASTLAVAQETYVEASRSIGTPIWYILFRRILPSVLSPVIVAVTLLLGIALIAEASLSFLGLGTQPPDPSWGNMLKRGYAFMLTQPFQMIPAGVAIALAVLSFNLVGDALRDALGLVEQPTRVAGKRKLGMTVVDRADRVEVADQDRADLETSNEPGVIHEPQPLLSVQNLAVEFAKNNHRLTVLSGVSFDVKEKEIMALVGESGSGKSVTSLAIMRLLPSPPARITGGRAMFEGKDLLDLDFAAMQKVRGNDISMVFQDPMSSLNPTYTIGNQLIESVRLHQAVSAKEARLRAIELLDLVRIPAAAERMNDFPHQLSGGMRQRVLIAMALVNRPKLLIADEPTTALDVTVQAQVLSLLHSLREELGMAVIFVTHDLGVVADIADRVSVMYAGQIVEQSPVHELFSEPRHPYTKKLLTAIPQSSMKGERLATIPGIVPPPGKWPTGCRFKDRCDFAVEACGTAPVQLELLSDTRTSRCIRAHELQTIEVA